MARLFPAFLLALTAVAPVPTHAQGTADLNDIQLQPGDMIRVAVWREPDLSGEFVVDPHGNVVLPMLGVCSVTGRLWADVKDELLRAYSRELRNPSIELTPFRRIFVLGEVNQPGLYPLHPTNMTLAGAVATAGGTTPIGEIRKIKVIRDGAIVREGVAGEVALSALDVRSGDQIFVDRRGWFDRNSTFLVSAILSVTSIVVTLVAR